MTQSRSKSRELWPQLRSVRLGVNLFIEKVLGQDVEVSVFLPDSVGSDELELLQSKLIEVILRFPDVRLCSLAVVCLVGSFFSVVFLR